jgi:hypothetical protein
MTSVTTQAQFSSAVSDGATINIIADISCATSILIGSTPVPILV